MRQKRPVSAPTECIIGARFRRNLGRCCCGQVRVCGTQIESGFGYGPYSSSRKSVSVSDRNTIRAGKCARISGFTTTITKGYIGVKEPIQELLAIGEAIFLIRSGIYTLCCRLERGRTISVPLVNHEYRSATSCFTVVRKAQSLPRATAVI